MAKRARRWQDLLGKSFPAQGPGQFPIAAYSEFMPPPRIGKKPYGTWTFAALSEADPHRWLVTAREETQFLAPGLENIGAQLINDLVAVAAGKTSNHIGALHLEDNPYWPENLAKGVGRLTSERFTMLSPLALSRTQDDKGRSRWTLFGGSDDGPSRGFWESFYSAPGAEIPAARGKAMLARLLQDIYGVPAAAAKNLKAAGLGILPDLVDPDFPHWSAATPPAWMDDLILADEDDIAKVRYLLTFRPFSQLSPAIQDAYLGGKLQLLPYPGSLVFWGSPRYRKLAQSLPGAMEIPLLQSIARHESNRGLRVPQAGWMFEKPEGKGKAKHDTNLGPLRTGFRRSHRWEWLERNADAEGDGLDQGIQRVLFSAHPDDVGLYGKPMARNAQVWTAEFDALLHGPVALGDDIREVIEIISGGGSFGYRMYYPPMTIGDTPVIWHRPVVAWSEHGSSRVLPGLFGGYFGANHPGAPVSEEVLFWPAFESPNVAEPPLPAKSPAKAESRALAHLNLRKLSYARQMLGNGKLPETFARSLLSADREFSYLDWLAQAAKAHADNPVVSEGLGGAVKLAGPEKLKANHALTYDKTANRDFEVAYWETISHLSMGDYTTKNNADVTVDPVTLKHRERNSRDLDPMGDYLITYYKDVIAKAGMTGKAHGGEHRFQWRTDFDFEWMGGWKLNQGEAAERNIICVIPGKSRKEAVILGDHYDTAYMEDVYGYGDYKGDRARVAAAGADDNCSATATLMLSAPIFLEMSKRGELECDIWLVHLTGEEFPSDCLGARNLSQSLIEGTLTLGVGGKKSLDLSGTTIRGVYVMDMIAHNNDNRRDVFQMAPGTDPQSMWLAFQAQRAAEIWKLNCEAWNEAPERKKAKRGKRSPDPAKVPALAKHLAPLGEVRPYFDPKSTLFNTDGQVFSDAGVPVVLFMENYDITRQGYHDQHDTMENIDLDYGSAVAAICIEAAARAATETPPDFEAIRKKAMGT
jgi:Peptidase family M28